MWQINGTEKVFDFEKLVNENHAWKSYLKDFISFFNEVIIR